MSNICPLNSTTCRQYNLLLQTFGLLVMFCVGPTHCHPAKIAPWGRTFFQYKTKPINQKDTHWIGAIPYRHRTDERNSREKHRLWISRAYRETQTLNPEKTFGKHLKIKQKPPETRETQRLLKIRGCFSLWRLPVKTSPTL